MAVISEERFSKPYLVGTKPSSSMPFVNFSSIKLPLSRSIHCRRWCCQLLHYRRYPLKVSFFPLLLLAIGTQFISSIPFASSLSLNSLSPVSSSPLSCYCQFAETKEMYGFAIQHTHLPCLQVGNRMKANYLTMEACKFVEGQQYTKRLNERQITSRSKVTCQRLKDQENGIIQAQEQRKMSLSGRVETDVEINIPAKEFHEIYVSKQYERGKMSPQTVTSCELLEGEWGKQGSVFLWKFDNDGVIELTKEELEAVDNENFTATLKVLEGEPLKFFKSFRIFSKVTPKVEGCVVNYAFGYEKIGDDIGDPELAFLDAYLDAFVVMTKDIAAYVTKQ